MLPNGKTLLLALFGSDLSYSRSPQMQNSWLRTDGINGVYLPLAAPTPEIFSSLSQALMDSDSFLGANITNPFKTLVTQTPGIIADDRVKAIGAANTLYKQSNKWALTNTDVDGIQSSLEVFFENVSLTSDLTTAFKTDLQNTHTNRALAAKERSGVAIIAGAGGAAAAAAFTLSKYFPLVEVLVVCRSPERAHAYLRSSHFEIRSIDSIQTRQFKHSEYLGKNVVLVNTLPLGQKGEDNPVCQFLICNLLQLTPSKSFYFDMTYGNPPTLKMAHHANIMAIDGSLMLKTQALKSYSIWKDSLKQS